jgi:cytochrome c556
MVRVHGLMVIAIAGLLGSPAAGQKRPYDLVMKDVGSTFDNLRKGLDGGNLVTAAADAAKLERLFRETEEFWTPFKTRDAIEAAKGAREASGAVAAAVKDKDLAKAKTAASGLGRFCGTCHNSHREQMPDKSYRIKP